MEHELAHIESPLRELALFAGAGGGILGGHLLGWRCVCAVEWEPYPAGVLIARQNEGILPPFPIWDDVRTFDGRPWRGIIDVVSGGFPCQDISAAGKGAGIDGERSGMWKEMARIIGEVRPRFAFVENSPVLTSRGLGTVLGDLAALGYDAEWGVLGAHHAGGPHERDRIWVLGADPDRYGLEAITDEDSLCQATRNDRSTGRPSEMGSARFWPEPRPVGARPMGVDNGMADELGAIRAAGNGQVPAVVRLAWHTLLGRIAERQRAEGGMIGAPALGIEAKNPQATEGSAAS
jgi:DNA (cytosine-5)-methyltransferase 1